MGGRARARRTGAPWRLVVVLLLAVVGAASPPSRSAEPSAAALALASLPEGWPAPPSAEPTWSPTHAPDEGTRAAAGLARIAASSSPSRPAQVADGLRFRHHARWEVDPGAATVRARHELRLTNTAPDRAVPGGIRFTYFPEVVIPVPVGATGLAATGEGGRVLPARLDATESPFVALAVVDLVPDLRYEQTQDVVVTYELPSTGPRATSAVRVNSAYVGFPLLLVGDPGETTVEVRVPAPFAVEVVGDPLDEAREGEVVVLSATVADPADWFASIVARNDDALLSTEVDLGDHDVIVRAWPDDPGWAEFAVAAVAEGVPVLERHIGLPWPADKTIEVLETAAPYVYGYAGWYQPLEGVIEVGDDLDGHVVLHELSHLWFNSSLFRERWINEGLAEVFSFAAAAELDLGELPAGPQPIDPTTPGSVALNEWSTPDLTQEVATEQETFGYNAAWSVMEQIRAEVGLDALAEVVGAAHRREPAYTGPGTDELAGTFAWTHLLDLLEDRAGSTTAVDLFARHVVGEGDRAQLEERSAGRAAYAAHEARSAPWATPAAVRRTMAAWRFSEAGRLMDEAEAVLDVRDRAEPVLDRAGVELDSLRASYEGAEALGGVLDEAEQASEAVAALDEAHRAVDRAVGPIGRVGLLFRSPSGEADAAAEALAGGDYQEATNRAAKVVDLVDGATVAGAVRLGGVAAVLALVAWALVVRRRVVGRRAGGGGAETSAELTAPGR